MHILLIRFSSLGDVVLQTSTVNWLRSLFGNDLDLTFLTASEFSSLIDHHSEVDRVITFDRRKENWSDLKKKIKILNKENPIDLILDVHATLRSWRIKLAFFSIPSLTVDKRRWERFFLTHLKSVRLKKLISSKWFGLEPQVERQIKDFQRIFSDNRGARRVKDFVGGKLQQLTSLEKPIQYSLPKPYMVLSPSASFIPKRWPVDRYIELANKILQQTHYDVVVLAGPQDDFCKAFNVIEDSRFHNFQGKTSLKESMSIIAQARLCIGNDSGMNHIAEAYGVKALTIFGPTDPRFGFSPHAQSSRFISKEFWCKPCSTTGSKSCSRDRLWCMENITVDEVFSLLREMEQEK